MLSNNQSQWFGYLERHIRKLNNSRNERNKWDMFWETLTTLNEPYSYAASSSPSSTISSSAFSHTSSRCLKSCSSDSQGVSEWSQNPQTLPDTSSQSYTFPRQSYAAVCNSSDVLVLAQQSRRNHNMFVKADAKATLRPCWIDVVTLSQKLIKSPGLCACGAAGTGEIHASIWLGCNAMPLFGAVSVVRSPEYLQWLWTCTKFRNL